MVVASGSSSCNSSTRFGPSSIPRLVTPGEVTARPGEAGDETSLTGLPPVKKTIGMVAVAAFATDAAVVPDLRNHIELTMHKIGRHFRQTIVLAFCPSVFDRNVLALNITDFLQAQAKRTQKSARMASGDALLRNPITGIAGCCARAASGHAAAAPPRRLMNSRRRISAPKLRGRHCIGSNGYFDRAQTGHQNHCRGAQPMSLMGQKTARGSVMQFRCSPESSRKRDAGFRRFGRVGPGNFTPSLSQIRT